MNVDVEENAEKARAKGMIRASIYHVVRNQCTILRDAVEGVWNFYKPPSLRIQERGKWIDVKQAASGRWHFSGPAIARMAEPHRICRVSSLPQKASSTPSSSWSCEAAKLRASLVS